MLICTLNKESWYLHYWDITNLYGWAMPQKVPVDGFKWVENTSQFSKDFIENCNEHSDEGYFLEVEIQCLEKLHSLCNDLPFLPEMRKLKNL